METIRIPLVGNITIRDLAGGAGFPSNGKGQYFLNHEYFEFENPFTKKKSIFSQKRPGIKVKVTPTNYTRVDKHWPFWSYDNGASALVYSGIDSSTGRTKFTVATTGGAPLASVVYAASTAPITSVEESRNSSGTAAILINRASAEDYAIWDGSLTAITVPAGSIGPMVTINGWTFLANEDGKIYNSPLNNPQGSYTDFITADMFPDGLRSLAAYNGFLVAWGPSSLEFFEVTTNTSGSPLRYRPEFHSLIGIAPYNGASESWVRGSNTIYWVGSTGQATGNSVFKFEGTDPKRITTPYIQNLLYGNGAPCFGIIGPKEYLILSTGVLMGGETVAAVYDIERDHWMLWKGADGQTITWSSLGINPLGGATGTLTSLIAYSTNIIGEFVKEADAGVFQDFGNAVKREVVTNAVDFGTKNNKVIHYVRLIGDEATSTANVTLYWSDDDGQNFSSGVTLDLSADDPITRGCGITKKRIFKLSDTLNGEYRYSELEIGYDICDV